MRKFIYLLAFVALLSSCTTQKHCSRKFPCIQKDSTAIITKTLTIFRDTTITNTIQGKDSIRKIPVYIDRGLVNSKKSRIENDYCISIAFVKDGELIHELIQKEQEIKITIPNAIKESVTITDKSKYITSSPKIIKEPSGWQWFQIYGFRILALLLLLYIGWKYAWKLLKPL